MATRTKQAARPATSVAHNRGKVVQVIGPVLDVEFEPERLPELYNALVIDTPGNGAPPIRLVAEVQQHIGRNQVRAVAVSTTDGVVRGMAGGGHGAALTLPVGNPPPGRLPNVLGRAPGRREPDPPRADRRPRHPEAPD